MEYTVISGTIARTADAEPEIYLNIGLSKEMIARLRLSSTVEKIAAVIDLGVSPAKEDIAKAEAEMVKDLKYLRDRGLEHEQQIH